MKNIIISIKAFIGFSILLGLIYPLAITGIAQIAMPQQANGSLIKENGQVIGSTLIGQKFDRPEYFGSRPSAVDYNAAGSGASNFGPTNKKFIEIVKERIEREGGQPTHHSPLTTHSIPPDMVLTSASGLDPDISLENAQFQVTRIAKHRGISEAKVNELISKNSSGIWAQNSVNVLKLNLALDKIGK